MRILMSTFGTRGDIQPFVALGKGLRARGYEVAICASEGFRTFIEAHGLTYAYSDNAFLTLTEQALAAAGPRQQMAIAGQFPAVIRQVLEDEWQAAQTFEPDAVIYHTKALGSYHIAEKLGIPQLVALPLPATPTRAFPYPFFAGMRLGATLNRLTYRLMALASTMWASTTNDFRTKTLGLPALSRFADLLTGPDGTPLPVLYPYSRHLVPVPDDFPAHVHVTGYWFLDESRDWVPDPALVRFLEAGAPPVYIGFGSMGSARSEARTRLVLAALERAGVRAVLASGWGGLTAADVPETIFCLRDAPHDWLFPHMRAVVHHGGAGTTAAGLRAGKPSVICPFLGDQPFWGWAVQSAGVGPAPIPQRRLTAARLAEAITTAVEDVAMQARAAHLGAQLRAEDGVACAVDIIGKVVAPRVPLPTSA